MMVDQRLPGELEVRGPIDLTGSKEFLRFWSGDGETNPHTCFIDPYVLGPDPFLFGMAIVDAVRHAAKAYAGVTNISEEAALQRVWEGVDAEREKPTDDVKQVWGTH